MRQIPILGRLRKGKTVAASVRASDPQNVAWVGIYPLLHGRHDTPTILRQFRITALPSARIYRIRVIEVPRSLIEEGASISEEEITRSRDLIALGDDDLVEKLRHEGLDLSEFDVPFKCDYPI